jgi:hypothetical protein
MMMGALLTALGILALLFRGGIDYTSRETVASGGNVRIEQDRAKTLEIPVAAGALAVAGGLGLMILASRQ